MSLPDEDLANRLPNGAERIAEDYVLESQVGFILRQASQRHATLFASRMGAETTPTQWAALAKLRKIGPTSQNQLGRMTAMDVATIKGVVDRLMKRGLVRSMADKADARRRLLALSEEGRAFVEANVATAHAITRETLAPLPEREKALFVALLGKLR
jgi:MarR family transcriptional regulator, lower aerobic nicotinate degradation pathway regulator